MITIFFNKYLHKIKKIMPKINSYFSLKKEIAKINKKVSTTQDLFIYKKTTKKKIINKFNNSKLSLHLLQFKFFFKCNSLKILYFYFNVQIFMLLKNHKFIIDFYILVVFYLKLYFSQTKTYFLVTFIKINNKKNCTKIKIS
jgi:hypothetical protein